MDGDHDIRPRSMNKPARSQQDFQELRIQRVGAEGMILKPNMAISEQESANTASVKEVAEKTIRF